MSGFDVCGIGSALVDVLVSASEDQVVDAGLIKGTMQLVDLADSLRIEALVGPGVSQSGGSAANTVAGLAGLGLSCAFIGRVAPDSPGSVFASDLASLDIVFASGPPDPSGATGRSLILITPDSDRTMCTTLGVAPHLLFVDPAVIESAAVTYIEGYLWDVPSTISLLRGAVDVAHAAGRRVALSLSDPFCVARHASDWRSLDVDILFGNEAELCMLVSAGSLEEAHELIRRDGLLVTVTRGPGGAWSWDGMGPVVATPAAPAAVVDTTGAGDLYASGFLYGLVQGRSVADCARIGAVTAAEVISHVGARPQVDLRTLV